MPSFGRVRAIIAVAALSLGLLASGRGLAITGAWPHADPAQPLVQAPRVCAPNIVPINHRCHVVDFAPLGTYGGRAWYYAFYATHWADRHGRIDRGFPIFLYLQKPATLRLGLWINDAPGLSGRWATTPPARPVIIQTPDQTYMGVTLKNADETPDQRLFRLHNIRWPAVKILDRSDADQAILDAATPQGCSIAGDGLFDWLPFEVTYPLKSDLTGERCGSLVAELAVRGDHARVVKAHIRRPADVDPLTPWRTDRK